MIRSKLLAAFAALLALAPQIGMAGPATPLVSASGRARVLPVGDTLQVNPATAGNASINLPHGTAPTSPVDGDCWTTTAGFYCRINGSTVGPYGTGGGAGTVTSVSVATANGVSGSVANATSTPAITLTLGAITPSSVAASGTLTGSNLSGTNTGDQSSIDGITGTLAQFNAALTGADFATGGGTATGTNTGDQDLSAYATTSIVAAGYQPLDADLTAIATLTTTSAGRALLDDADATAQRATLGLGTLATQSGTFSGTSSGTNTGDQSTIVGITGTLAQFNTALTGADFATGGGTATGTNTGDQDLSGYPTTSAVAAGYQPLATVLTNTTASFTTAKDTKLSGIATGATANSADATLLDRANHTGSQAESTVSGLVSDLAAKAPLASPTFTGTVSGVTAAMVGLGNVTNVAQTSVTGLTGTQSVAAFKTGLSLAKADVGLGSVDNTADSAKSVASAAALTTARTIALSGKATASGCTFDGTAACALSVTAVTLVAGDIPAIAESGVTNLVGDLAAKAPLASPVLTGMVYHQQGAPTAKTATGTLTIAELLTGIITSTSTTAVALTLPTGTLSDAGILAGALAADRAFDWYVINLGSSSGAMTLTAGTAHTIVGNAVCAISTTCHWLTRKTAANTFVTYRLG